MFLPSATGLEQLGRENIVYPETLTTVEMVDVPPMQDSPILKVKYLMIFEIFV